MTRKIDVVRLNDLHNCDVETLLSLNDLHIAVYGTLRKGQRADGMLEDCEYVDTYGLSNTQFMMLTSNNSFPYMVNILDCTRLVKSEHIQARMMTMEDGSSVFNNPCRPVIELYRGADKEVVHRLDSYEGYPHLYHRNVYFSEGIGHIAMYEYADLSGADAVSTVARQDWCYHYDRFLKERAMYRSVLADFERAEER